MFLQIHCMVLTLVGVLHIIKDAYNVCIKRQNYGLINRARGPYEEVFVLTFKACGPCVRSIRLECQNKYFPYGPKSRLIRALLYTYRNKIVYDEILLS